MLQWAATYNGTANNSDVANAIAVDNAPDGNIIVGGSSTTDTLLGHLSSVIIKYTSDGQELWRKTYITPGESNGITSLAVTHEAHIFVGGWVVKNSNDIDYLLLKYDSLGNLLWEKRYNGEAGSIDYANNGTLDAEQNFIVTGFSTDINNIKCIKTIKYDAGGNTLWEVAYYGTENMDAEGNSVLANGSGNIYVFGNSYNNYGV